MNTAITSQQINEWARLIARELDFCIAFGESKTFDHAIEIGDGYFTADVHYTCETAEDDGTEYASPSWWVESESLEVWSVTDPNGNDRPEIAEQLEFLLN